MQMQFQNSVFNGAMTPAAQRDMSVSILNSLVVPSKPQQLVNLPINMPVAQSSPLPKKVQNVSPMSEKVSFFLIWCMCIV